MYKKIIKERGLSVTKSRIDILKALDEVNQPVTIEVLKKSLTEPMDTSTIYRSLKILVDVGIVYQTDFREGVSYFEFQNQYHHHHIVCTSCKSRSAVDFCFDKKFSDIEKKTGYTITNHMIEFFGLCETCLK